MKNSLGKTKNQRRKVHAKIGSRSTTPAPRTVRRRKAKARMVAKRLQLLKRCLKHAKLAYAIIDYWWPEFLEFLLQLLSM